jgi:hypothetical protein
MCWQPAILVAGQRPHSSPELEFCALSDGDGSRIGYQPNSADPLIAVLFALALMTIRAHQTTRRPAVGRFAMVRIAVYFAPIGAFGSGAFAIVKYG